MPIYSVQGPDGRIYDIEGPEGASDAQVVSALRNHLASLPPPEETPKPKTGIGAAVGKGVESIISSGRTAYGALTGDAEEAARAGLERGEAMGKKYADQVSLQKVKDAYNKDGVLSAAGEALSQIPAAIAEQAPNLAAMAGSARLGATAGSVLGPVGATVGGIGGALLPSLIQQFSGNVERRKSEGLPADIGLSAATALPQAGLEVAGSLIPFGGRIVQKLTGIPMGALLSRSAEGAAKLADERLLTVLAKGVGVGALAEIPTEITQQMLERAQAGLSLSSPDALKEYGETAYQAGLLAPLGAVGRLSERGGARAQVEQKAQEDSAAAAAVQQQQAAVAAQQKAEADANPNYAIKLRADYVAANVEMQRLNDAVRALSAEKDPLSVADAKDARAARDAYAKETMQPLVDEIRRVRQLHPGFDFRPTPAAVAPAAVPAIPIAAVPAIPTAVAPDVVESAVAPPPTTVTPMPTAPVAATKRGKKVEEAAVVSEPAPFTAPARMDEINSYVESVMGSPEVAAEMVASNEQIPGLTPEENAIFLETLQQRLAQEELTGVTTPAVTETGVAPVKKAKSKKAAGTEPVVTRATPPTDPNAVWMPTVALDYGTYTIENDGQYPTYSFKTPLAVTPQASLQQLRVTEDRSHLLFINSKGEKVRISVAPDHIRMENLATGGLQDYDFGSGKDSPTLTALFGGDLLDQLNKTSAENRLPTFLNALTQRLGFANLDRFTQEYADMLGGKPLAEKTKGKKAAIAEAPVVPVVEDTTAEPTEPKTLEQSFAAMQPIAAKPSPLTISALKTEIGKARKEGRRDDARELIAELRVRTDKSQYMIPGAAPLKRTGAVQRQELTQEIRTELTQLGKNLTVARQEGRKGDALEIIDRMRYLQEQGKAPEAGPVLKGAANTGQSETIETKPADRASPRALQQDIARAQALPNLSDTNAELLDKLQQNLPALLRYKAPTTGQTPGLETTIAVPEAARGAGDTRVRIVDFLDSLRQGLPAETEARNLQQQIAQIERQAQQEVSPRELQGMLAKVSKPKSSATATRDVYAAPLAERTQTSYRKFKAPEKAALDSTAELSRNERGLLRLVGENQATIMADPAARMAVARWLSSDVGQGIGDATQDLRKYFGVAEKAAPTAQEDMFPAERKQETERENTRAMYEDLFNEPKPAVAATRTEKQEESRKERKLTGDLSALPGKQISFERRRAMLDAIDDAPVKRQAFEDAINDANLPQAERDAAQTQLTAYLAKLRKKAADKDETYATAYRLRGEESALVQKHKQFLKDTSLSAAQKAQRTAWLNMAQRQLNNRDAQLARLRGVEITPVQTAEERSKTLDTLFRETYGQAVSEEAQAQLDKTKGRALGPVTRKEVFPAKVFFTGEEGNLKETEKRTYTKPDMRLGEKRGVKQRDVQISKAEMQEANENAETLLEAAQARLKDLQAKVVISKKSIASITDANAAGKQITGTDGKPVDLKETNLRLKKLLREREAALVEAAKDVRFYKTDLKYQAEDLAHEKVARLQVAGEVGKTKLSKTAQSEAKMLRGTSGLNDTPLSANNIDLLGGNKLAAVLTNISEKSSNHVARRIAGKLAAVVEVNGVNVKLVEVTAEDSPDAPGSTSRDGNRVRINENTGLSEETVVHEAAHAATMFELDKADDKLTPNQRKAKDELNRMRDSVLADKDFDNKVIKDGDIHEFVAEGLASNVVQQYMRTKQWEGRSLWQQFKDGLLRLIGVNTPAKGPMLDRFLDLAENFIAAKAENAPSAQETRLRSVGSLLSPKDVKYANPGLAAAGVIGDTFIAKERGVIDRVRAASGGWLGSETMLVDRFAPLERLSKGMEALKGSQMMYYLRMYDQRMNFTAQSVANGAIQRVAKKRPDGRTEYVVESVDGANIQQVVDILKKAPAGSPDAANRLFTMYLAGIRAKNKGFQTLHFGKELTEAQLDSAMVSIRATPGLEENFKQARDVYNEYNRNMVGFLEQSGAISKAHAARLTKENDYVPFYREQNGVALLTIGGETPIRIGSTAEQPYLHELVGGDRPILDFLTSSVQNTALITDMGLRNLATKNSMNELEDIGLAQIRPGPGTADTKTVRFKVDGDDYHAIVDTDEAGVPADLLVKGMQGIPTQMSLLFRAMGLPATILRRAVTLSPTYAARQIFRDSLAAPLLSGADFVPVLGALKEINIFGKSSATKSTLEKRGITGGQIFAGGSSSEAMTKILNDMLTGKGNIGSLIAKAEALNMEADAATRRAQYNSYIKQGLSEMEATLMALESMNFNKRGASPSIHMANALIPFFNSQIQGLNVLYKALTGKLPFDKRLKIQEKLITNGALMFGASLAYAAMMQDDEAYKNATPEQKYGNWFIRIPGIDEPIKFPVPFEVGYLFKALPEALYNSMANENGSEEAFKAFRTIILQTIPGGSSYFIPQAIKPAIEYGMGKSFYTGRDILSRREQAVLPEQQFREGSNEISKMLGSGLGLSPIKIEALVSGYTGTMGLALMQVLSMGVPTGESPEKTTKRLSDMPVIGSSFQPNDAGGIINAVYERMNDVKKVKTTVDRMLSEGRVAEAKELISQRSEEFAQSGVADYFTSNMQQITKYENAIRASNLTGDEKQAKLAEMRQLKIRLAETVRQATDAAKKVD